MIQIHSIQIGSIVTEGVAESNDITNRLWTSAFNKSPVTGFVQVGKLGIIGDQVADKIAHGGPDKAILCYAASHYATWAIEHPELDMSIGGGLGENLTLSGVDESSVCIGDVYCVGECRLQVSQPRQPCWKIARRWGVKTLTKEVAQSGRTGWYVRVLDDGSIAAGDELKLTSRPHEDWTIKRANDVLFRRDRDEAAKRQLLDLPELADAWKHDVA